MPNSRLLLGLGAALGLAAQSPVPRYGVFEQQFTASGSYANPYTGLTADAVFTRPGGATLRVPLFWDGGANWRVRLSPDTPGRWSYQIHSADPGLHRRSGSFTCEDSANPGPLRAAGHHFQRRNGSPVWFLADTAWAYFTDIPEEKHGRGEAEAMVKARAAQGFNAIHSMLLSEGGDGNRGGPPWHDIAAEKLNPAYFQEVDQRIAFANANGLTVGIAIAWADKGRNESFAWNRIPNRAARERYARYVAARFSAYDTYFLVSGEWHGEVRARAKTATPDDVFDEFVAIGNELHAADPHGRMKGIHPMTAQGSVREYAAAPWMSFSDYQQNYVNLHGRALLSRSSRGPVVNSEYGYLLRDSNDDGRPDKDNSQSTDVMRFASWDIVMAGAYLVNGFGTTYFGGHRDPGPFDLNAAKNKDWERQIGYIRKFFESLDWTRLAPADELLSSAVPRDPDGVENPPGAPPRGLRRPPKAAYWALATSGETYVVYVRGVSQPVTLELGARPGRFRVRTFNPRTGEFSPAAETVVAERYEFRPPDSEDWILLLQK
ncbi:MAG: DUF4038 domain-containing protein [Bryobacteraceae bacterium]